MDPIVALTTTIDWKGGEYRQPQVTVYANYIQSLQRAGVVPSLVSPAHGPDSVDRLVGMAAGLVLTGGEDVAPSRYGEDPIPELGEVNVARDTMEWRAVQRAMDVGMPVLGICRGMQLLNVYFGGTLYQDLPAQRGPEYGHYQDAPWGHHHHNVRCAVDSRLERILGDCSPLEINSFHHQAVRDLAPTMRCTAQADDGLIEAIESAEHPWVVGIQWHPERQEADAPGTDPNVRIFEAFATAVRGFAEE